jgi:exopolyphosphatase/pppGpp-phosphohydrolase
VGVKCLHAHWAWHLAGGDDPVGQWIARQLALTVVSIHDDRTEVRLGQAGPVDIPWGAVNLSRRWLADTDPPRPEALTNALGSVADHLDDVIRDHPPLGDATAMSFRGPTATSLAQIELGHDVADEAVDLDRDAAEEIFRIVATEPARQRAHNPGLPSEHVDLIIATCCIVLAFMRRLHLDRVELAPWAPGGVVG